MQEGRAEGLGVEPEAGADLRDLDRVGDEVLPGAPLLVAVALAGERERPLDDLAVDLEVGAVAVLGDDGEQVAEQRPLGLRQVLGELG
jgi:hypothetical protein